MTFFLLALMGLSIGSFLNVVIIRYPQMLNRKWQTDCREFLQLSTESPVSTFNLAVPRSQCPCCRKPLSLWHNLPLISYIGLRGRCEFCRQPISIQYPLVELLTVATTLVVFWQFGWQLKTIAVWIMTWSLIVLSGIDWKTQILPDDITLSLLWVGLIINLDAMLTTPTDAILGAVVGYVLLWVIANLFKLIRKKPGMGQGDFKMLAMLGAWLGLSAMIYGLLIAILLSLITNLSLLFFKKIRYDQTLPFGPWLAVAGWLMLMFGSNITAWITRCCAWV